MAVATGTAVLASALIGGGIAAASAEYQRKSSSKAASKARKLMGAPEDPKAIPETGGDPLDFLKRRRRSGRAETIQAGSLIPENTGTKSLLG